MKYANVDGRRIAYDDRGPAGAGAAYLCLPGWGVNRGFFTSLAERLALKRRVLTLDWSGHGDSQAPDNDFGHAELLADALGVLESAGVDSVIPIGQAHGAWIALDLRRRLGARVRGVVANSWLLVDPPPPFLAVLEALQDSARWQQARDQLLAMWTAGAPENVVQRVNAEMGSYDFAMWSRAARCIAAEYTRYGNPLRAAAAMAPPPPLLHLFSQPRAPEFLALQQSFAQEHPWFEVCRLDAVSHFPALEAPEASAEAIERFAATLDS